MAWRRANDPPDDLRRVLILSPSGPVIGFYDEGHQGNGRGWWLANGSERCEVNWWIDIPPEPKGPTND
jgi:hypothetical protein